MRLRPGLNASWLLACLALPSSVLACSFPQVSEEQLVAQAQSIFRARVTEVRLAQFSSPEQPGESTEVVEARYEVKEVIKGQPPASGVVRDLPFGVGNCSQGLTPGAEYLFIPGRYDLVWLPSGSFGYVNAEGREVAPVLQRLRQLSKTSTQ